MQVWGGGGGSRQSHHLTVSGPCHTPFLSHQLGPEFTMHRRGWWLLDIYKTSPAPDRGSYRRAGPLPYLQGPTEPAKIIFLR